MLLALVFMQGAFTPDVCAEHITLSLSDAFANAIENNKTIAYYAIDENNAEMEFAYEKGIYIPQFGLATTWNRYGWGAETLDNYADIESSQLAASLERKNALGGVSSLNFSTQEDKTIYNVPLYMEREYRSSIFMKYEQPLLKGFGSAVTNFEIDKSGLQLELSHQKFIDNKNSVLFTVFRDYFSLLLTVEELRIKKNIRENTQSLFDIVKEKVEMRRLPVTDLNKMQAVLVTRDRELLDIENTMQRKKYQLMLSMYNNVDRYREEDYNLTTSIDDIITSFKQSDLSAITAKAERLDFEIIGYDNDLLRYKLELAKARNDLKPELIGSVELGVDGYDSDNWFSSARTISPENYRITLSGSLKLPVTNTQALSKMKIVENRIKQIEIQKEKRLQEVKDAIFELFDDLKTVKQKVALSNEIISISKQNLENEIERLVGEKSTVLNTLDYQTSLIAAELDMIATKLDYIILIGAYHFYQREMENLIKNQ